MNPISFQSAPPAPPPPWFPLLPPDPPRSVAFWEIKNVYNQMKELQETLNLAEAIQKELETLMVMKHNEGSVEDIDIRSRDPSVPVFSKYLEDRRIDLKSQEMLSVEAANSVMVKLRAQMEPFRYIADEKTPWEEKSAAVRLVNKAHKSKRNKMWRKRKRKHIAEMVAKEHEQFEQADQEADEWRAREIAKDIAKRKVQKMNEIAKLKAKEERKRLESELELVLVVEKLQELRSIRIQKLKKQGHFLPDEDDKFLERVQAAVEEEERQALAAADTDAAKDAIANAEESRKTIHNSEPVSTDGSTDNVGVKKRKDEVNDTDKTEISDFTDSEPSKNGSEKQAYAGLYDSVANLPIEFYHYYHGSNTDLGTLIEVRRTWDAYIRPGGSRIPGHWVQPPPPANEIWASYLIRPK
ncbi:hypothetical protein Ddye_017679 [Dipteronia dyeriana]|uniref:Uncharacterized protein n=1 Tax=Dipteronia dyeriana TaxID=168575 RepID=A0AAD9X1M1_9ROSI|nr:hypothetical protein Ddye_017679 [Dipteronia dyeriana]